MPDFRWVERRSSRFWWWEGERILYMSCTFLLRWICLLTVKAKSLCRYPIPSPALLNQTQSLIVSRSPANWNGSLVWQRSQNGFRLSADYCPQQPNPQQDWAVQCSTVCWFSNLWNLWSSFSWRGDPLHSLSSQRELPRAISGTELLGKVCLLFTEHNQQILGIPNLMLLVPAVLSYMQ